MSSEPVRSPLTNEKIGRTSPDAHSNAGKPRRALEVVSLRIGARRERSLPAWYTLEHSPPRSSTAGVSRRHSESRFSGQPSRENRLETAPLAVEGATDVGSPGERRASGRFLWPFRPSAELFCPCHAVRHAKRFVRPATRSATRMLMGSDAA